MGKESFISYLKSISAENSGKPQGYSKGMEVIEAIFFSKALTDSVDVWNFITLDNIDALREVVLREQKNDDGIFKDYKPVSYWRDGFCSAALNAYKSFLLKNRNTTHQPPVQKIEASLVDENVTCLPKPFLLLAGISGTGKTRFVREQAKASAALYGMTEGDNYCLVPVRPDWHEPSDLLGYISRIGTGGTRYVTTDLLRFVVAAWKHIATQIIQEPQGSISPFWLCLDEMNLAPVEQYFADYLSILETRKWEDGAYSCDPLLKPAVIQQQLDDSGRDDLWAKLGLAGDDPLSIGLRENFSANGIPLPYNLIVAGTVNMDETTHGFSRKVIDRALTIDFGEFFPNNYDGYYDADKKVTDKTLNFPRLSRVNSENDLAKVSADPDGRKTIGFLTAINVVLTATPFELAYRALNEALVSVACFKPTNETELQAVWDDFLMMKVLPRIEGDAEKLSFDGSESLLTRLKSVLKNQLPNIWEGKNRPDLLRKAVSGAVEPLVLCRSKSKLDWMQSRLASNTFTTFWP
ncbi:MAG: AAA family ATPase [Desulfuromonadales bacterium]